MPEFSESYSSFPGPGGSWVCCRILPSGRVLWFAGASGIGWLGRAFPSPERAWAAIAYAMRLLGLEDMARRVADHATAIKEGWGDDDEGEGFEDFGVAAPSRSLDPAYPVMVIGLRVDGENAYLIAGAEGDEPEVEVYRTFDYAAVAARLAFGLPPIP